MKPFFMVYQRLQGSMFLGLAQEECDTFAEAKAKQQELKAKDPDGDYVVMRAIQTEPAPARPKEVKLLPPPRAEVPLEPPMPV